MHRRAIGRAHARAGLLGNPSDVYEGKAIAVSICDFSAEVTLEAAERFGFEAGPAESTNPPDILVTFVSTHLTRTTDISR